MAVETEPSQSPQSSIVIAAGTYEGAVAGYEVIKKNDDDTSSTTLQLIFASPSHQGSVRSLASCSKTQQQQASSSSSCLLVSTGYDESLITHDFGKRATGTGHIRTPADLGTPSVVAFSGHHCLVGFGPPSGSIVIYKRRDFSVQHVFQKGHEGGGVASMAVHTSGKLMISGGATDGKVKVWDLERGRLAFSSSVIQQARTHVEGKKRYDSIECMVWRTKVEADECYAFCHGSHITVRDVATGKDLLDVNVPAKVNQVCFLDGKDGLFVAAACDDGSLPVLAVNDVDDNSEERRAILAIEPASAIAGVERYKCIQAVSGYVVATATSTGVVSLMDLSGAVRMILSGSSENDDDDDESNDGDDDEQDVDGDEGDNELAVDILDSQLLGTGARITCLSVWVPPPLPEEKPSTLPEQVTTTSSSANDKPSFKEKNSRMNSTSTTTVLGDAELAKARKLVSKAKKIQKKKNKRKHGIKAGKS